MTTSRTTGVHRIGALAYVLDIAAIVVFAVLGWWFAAAALAAVTIAFAIVQTRRAYVHARDQLAGADRLSERIHGTSSSDSERVGEH